MKGFSRVPSVQRLVDAFGTTRGRAEEIRTVLRGEIDLAAYDDVHTGYPWVEQALEAANQILGLHGVEVLRSGTSWHPYWTDIVALYLNTGDTYQPTLLYNRLTQTLSLTSYGDFVERNPKLFEED